MWLLGASPMHCLVGFGLSHPCGPRGLPRKFGRGLLDIEELHDLECHALPGSGACSAMFTSCPPPGPPGIEWWCCGGKL